MLVGGYHYIKYIKGEPNTLFEENYKPNKLYKQKLTQKLIIENTKANNSFKQLIAGTLKDQQYTILQLWFYISKALNKIKTFYAAVKKVFFSVKSFKKKSANFVVKLTLHTIGV